MQPIEKTSSQVAQNSALRFIPVVHLETGDRVMLAAESRKTFDDGARAMFGVEANKAVESPAVWLANHIKEIALSAQGETVERPILVQLPIACVIHPDTPLTCDSALRQTHLCPQEICFELPDAALALPGPEVRNGIEALRQNGFRISVDATRSWQAPMSAALRLLLDSLRVDARQLAHDDALEARVEAAQSCGMSIIAENAAWRDGDYLARCGVEYAIRPQADA